MTTQEFESMTPAEFLIKLKGFYWSREREQKDRAHALVSIINTCGNLKKGKRVKLHDLYVGSNLDPRNPFYRGYLGLPT